jgi:hypothetical protein
MNKYNTEDYFSVVEKRTGRKIADCGDFSDAKMLLHMDTQNRQIVRNKFLMGPVFDVEIPKALPTNEIVKGAAGNSQKIEQPNSSNGPNEFLPQFKLPQGQGNPVEV